MRSLSVVAVFNTKLEDALIPSPEAFITPAVTSIPVLAVIRATESTFLTSSYVNVPPILTSLVNVATPDDTRPLGKLTEV